VGKNDLLFRHLSFSESMKAIVPSLRRNLRIQVAVLASLLPGIVSYPVPLRANPQGPQVAIGKVGFQGLNTPTLNINNLSQKAVINWQSFSIQRGEVTNIHQGRNAFTLNRVVTGNPTEIYGQLRAANGGVAVINPNGIVVGAGGTIDVAGMLTLSTLDISNDDFLRGGPDRFRGTTAAGVRNYGTVTSSGGDVVMMGNFLQNAGTVSAPRGVVAFGAGGDIIVDQAAGAKISVQAGGRGGGVGIDNSGEIHAAAAELKAHGNVYALAIKNDGLVRASGYNFKGGRLTLNAGSSGGIINTGNLVARNGDGSGGRVEISGGRVQLGSNGAGTGRVDASGDVGRNGGTVSVTGSEVSVDAGAVLAAGGASGGTVRVVGSQSATVAGSVDVAGVSGAGGRVDVSGNAVTLASTARVDASGVTAGGKIQAGGGFQGRDTSLPNSTDTVVEQGALLIADASEGNGGQVVVWSDGGTLFEGEIQARARGAVGNGGFVEVSGKQSLQLGGLVDTSSQNGRNGTFLIDPVNITVSAVGGSGTMTDETLRNFVLANNVILHTAGAGAASGTISVLSGAKVIYDSPNSLTFLAHGDIFIDGDIKNIGDTDVANTGHINLVAGWDGTLPAGLPNTSGNPQTLNDTVSAADFINADGSPKVGRFGSWGATGSRIFFNEAGLEYVEVGSARGQTNVFADVIQLRGGRADGRFAQIGYRRVADVRDAVVDVPNKQYGGYFANPDDQIVDGDINVSAKSDIFMRQSDEANADDLDRIRSYAYTMIGHGGLRRADNGIDAAAGTNGFGYDAGAVFVDNGHNSGDITVFAGRSLVMRGARVNAQTQIGHGGHAEGNPNNGNFRPGLVGTILSDLKGDINVKAGFIDMEAGLYDDAPVQIGHGGFNVRGEFSGDINVTTTIGNLRGQAAPNLGDAGPVNPTDGRWTNNRDRSYVMIGHGGSGAFHPSALPARTITVNGSNATGSYAGDGIAINPNTGIPYGHNGDISVTSAGRIHLTASGNFGFAKIGHGGNDSHGDHWGNISVEAKSGNITFDRIAIQVDRNGLDRRNVGDGAFVQIGHGGRRSSGGNRGDIDVRATGDVEFYAGRNEAFAMIGHGGRGIVDVVTLNSLANQRNTLYANGSHTGDIRVQAGGDIRFRAGFGTGGTAFAMIGNGGYRQYADVLENVAFPGTTPFGGGAARMVPNPAFNPALPVSGANPAFLMTTDGAQQGHNGDITLIAGGDVDFRAGQVSGEELPGQEPFGIEMNRTQNFVMIGNGGDEAWGDHWGNIDITAGDDLILEARGGWNAITYEGTNEGPYDPVTASAGARGTPRLSANEDNGGNGVRNFAFIGNGGFNAGHRNNPGNPAQPAHRDGTGKRSEGMGVFGPSDITIDVGGDVIVRAAQLENIGPRLVTRAFLAKDNSLIPSGGGARFNDIIYRDVFGNPVTLSATVGIHNFYPDIVNRVAPNLGPAGSPTNGPGGETMGRLNISVSGYRLTSDGTVANRDRFIMDYGSGFAGGEIVYLTGPGVSELGLSETQAYQVFNVRVNETDFQLRTISPTGALGTAVAVPAAPSGAIALNQTWNGWKSPDPVPGASDSFAQIGNGGRSSSLTAAAGINPADGDGHRGNININAGGGVIVKASNIDPMVSTGQTLQIQRIAYDGSPLLGTTGTPLRDIFVGPGAANGAPPALNDMVGTNFSAVATGNPDTVRGQLNPSFRLYNYAQIGHGGWTARGDHMGDINIHAGKTSNGTGLLVWAGEGREDFAQVGHGGFDSDGYDPLGGVSNDNNRLNDTGSRGNIMIDVDGKVTVQGGGVNGKVVGRTGTTTDTTAATPVAGSGSNVSTGLVATDESRFSYAQIGHGGGANGGTHSGNITVISNQGGLDVLAGNSTRFNYAQIGNGGYNSRGQAHSGDILVRVRNAINIRGGTAFRDTGAFTAGNPLLTGVPLTGPTAGGRIPVTGATNTSGSAVVTLGAVVPGLFVGQPVLGAGIPGGTVIQDISPDGLTVTLSAVSTANVATFAAGHDGQISHPLGNYAQIGNGGWDADPQAGNLDLSTAATGGFTGKVSVISTHGGLNMQAGGNPSLTRNDDTFFRGLSAHIGNGGNFTDGNHGGDILVSVRGDASIMGGAGGRDSFTLIGHGGHQINGHLTGDIQVIAGGDLKMNRGADVDASPVGSTNRAGAQLFNNWTKIGHGDHRFAQRTDGIGELKGDIHISVGDSLFVGDLANRPFAAAAYSTLPARRSDQVLIGHVDSKIAIQDAFRAKEGDTFIAVSRNNPFSTGTGVFRNGPDAVVMSAGEGIYGELRLYMPSSNSNEITEGTWFNNAQYTNTPAPGSGRADEQTPFTEHLFTNGPNGELQAAFTPTGPYPFQGFGLYNIYYGGTAPVIIPPEPPVVPPPPGPPVIPPFGFGPFVFDESYDPFFRSARLFLYDGYDEVLYSVAYSDAVEDESDPSTGGNFLEELLDGAFGNRTDRDITVGSTVIEEETDEERRRRLERSSRQVGRGALTFYVYNPATNKYSSFTVFGIEQSRLSVTR